MSLNASTSSFDNLASDHVTPTSKTLTKEKQRSLLVSQADYFDVTPNDIAIYLKKRFRYRNASQEVLYQRLINNSAADRELAVVDSEVQTAADQFRYDNNLENAASTLAWLEEQQVSAQLWEESIRDRLISDKLSHHLFDTQVERVFAETRLGYDRVSLYQIVVPYEQVASELFYQIEEDEVSFYEAAHLYDMDSERRRRCGFEGVLERRMLEPTTAVTVFGAHPQQVTSPMATAAGYHLFWVEEFLPAELTEPIRQNIIQQLFQQWLRDELQYHQNA